MPSLTKTINRSRENIEVSGIKVPKLYEQGICGNKNDHLVYGVSGEILSLSRSHPRTAYCILACLLFFLVDFTCNSFFSSYLFGVQEKTIWLYKALFVAFLDFGLFALVSYIICKGLHGYSTTYTKADSLLVLCYAMILQLPLNLIENSFTAICPGKLMFLCLASPFVLVAWLLGASGSLGSRISSKA